MKTVLEKLILDHRAMMNLIPRFDGLKNDSIRRRNLHIRFISILQSYMAAEECVLHPELMEHGLTRSRVQHLKDAHSHCKQLVKRLDDAGYDDPSWPIIMKALTTSVRKLINGKELHIFPVVEQLISTEKSAEMTALLQEAKREAQQDYALSA